MNITVVGAGYVGLSNAVLLSTKYKVKVIDIVAEKVAMLNNHRSPIEDEYIKDYLANKELDLTATTDKIFAYKDAEFIIICTPTDYDENTELLDTSSIDATIKDVLEINKKATIVIRSTIPIGYVDMARERFEKENIFFAPEFLREGKALEDNLYPSRIVVGSHSAEAEKFAKLLSSCALSEDVPMVFTDTVEAESIKLFANTYLAMRVSFFNELDTYAELKGLNAKQIVDGVCLDPRIGHRYNNPSFGYGGYCLPKDSKQLKSNFKGIPNDVISAVVNANNTRKEHIAQQIIKRNPKKVGIYRLIAKTETDNFRQSAILDIIEKLKNSKIPLMIYEPTLKVETFMGVDLIRSLEEFKSACEVIVANRFAEELRDVEEKVYTKDLYFRD